MRSSVRREEGASAVELALTLPILIAVMLAIFDFGQAWLIKQNLSMCSREGARLASSGRPVTNTEVDQRVSACLAEANAAGTVLVTFTPANLATARPGDQIIVQTTRNFPLVILPRTLALKGRTRMVKE